MSHRYHQMFCQKRGPHEWSRRPSASVIVERLVADRDRARDRHVLLGVAASEHLLGIEVGLLLAFLPLGFTAPRPSDRLQD